jgi:hypothetical protein
VCVCVCVCVGSCPQDTDWSSLVVGFVVCGWRCLFDLGKWEVELDVLACLCLGRRVLEKGIVHGCVCCIGVRMNLSNGSLWV